VPQPAPAAAPTAPAAVTLTTKQQAMEGDLKLAPGAVLQVGYDFTIPGRHVAQTVSFTAASVTFPYTCLPAAGAEAPGGTTSVPIADASVTDPADSSGWFPSGDQHDAAVYQASYTVPTTLCPPDDLVRLQQGGVFTTGIASNGAHEDVHVRWHYSANGTAGGWSGTYGVTP
jgi:hypothetical protein